MSTQTDTATAEMLYRLLPYAAMSPSVHNTQPWLFVVDNGQVRLFADRTRRLAVIDPDDRQLTISCGAALFHLRLAMRYFGFADEVTFFPKTNPDLLAIVCAREHREATLEERLLFRAIALRHTYRRRFEKQALPESLVSGLQSAAVGQGGELRVIDSETSRSMVAALIAEGDHIQSADEMFRDELVKWLRVRPISRRRDGIPTGALGTPRAISPAMPAYLRCANWGARRAARDEKLALGSPSLAMLWTERDEPLDWLRAGEALAALLLLAAVNGVHASFFNQPIEVPRLRNRLRLALEVRGFPQMLMRLGFAPEAKRTPRRPLTEAAVNASSLALPSPPDRSGDPGNVRIRDQRPDSFD